MNRNCALFLNYIAPSDMVHFPLPEGGVGSGIETPPGTDAALLSLRVFLDM
jgi:hypothetical protein